MIRLTAACVLAAALFAVPASAQERNFEGPSVTVVAGIDDSVDVGKGQTGALYGGQIGYDVRNGSLVFGVEGEITGASTKNCDTFTSTAPVSTIRYCARAGRDLYAGGRIGVVVGEATLLYGKVGYTNARNRVEYSATPATSFLGSGNSDGVRVGAGVERAIGSNVSLKAEYRYSNYEGAYSRHQGVVGVGFRF